MGWWGMWLFGAMVLVAYGGDQSKKVGVLMKGIWPYGKEPTEQEGALVMPVSVYTLIPFVAATIMWTYAWFYFAYWKYGASLFLVLGAPFAGAIGGVIEGLITEAIFVQWTHLVAGLCQNLAAYLFWTL